MTTVAMAVGPVIGLQIATRWSLQVMFTTSVVICLAELFLTHFIRFQEQSSKENDMDLRIDVRR